MYLLLILFILIFIPIFFIFIIKFTVDKSYNKKTLVVFIGIFITLLIIVVFITLLSQKSTTIVDLIENGNYQVINKITKDDYIISKEKEISETLNNNYISIKSISVSIDQSNNELIGVLEISQNNKLNFENLCNDIINIFDEVNYIKLLDINGVVIHEFITQSPPAKTGAFEDESS